MDVVETSKVEEPYSPPASTNKDGDKEQSSLMDENSLKWTRIAKGNASREVTPFIKMLDIFSRLPRTPKEDPSIIWISDLSFV